MTWEGLTGVADQYRWLDCFASWEDLWLLVCALCFGKQSPSHLSFETLPSSIASIVSYDFIVFINSRLVSVRQSPAGDRCLSPIVTDNQSSVFSSRTLWQDTWLRPVALWGTAGWIYWETRLTLVIWLPGGKKTSSKKRLFTEYAAVWFSNFIASVKCEKSLRCAGMHLMSGFSFSVAITIWQTN